MAATGAEDDNRNEALTDDALESEIELVSELVVAATHSDGPLGQAEVDQLLGVSPKKDSPAIKPDGADGADVGAGNTR